MVEIGLAALRAVNERQSGRLLGVAFDILTEGGTNRGFVLAGGTLHMINLETGALTAAGTVAGLPQAEVIDIAAMR